MKWNRGNSHAFIKVYSTDCKTEIYFDCHKDKHANIHTYIYLSVMLKTM